jgi:hypothetical protein
MPESLFDFQNSAHEPGSATDHPTVKKCSITRSEKRAAEQTKMA